MLRQRVLTAVVLLAILAATVAVHTPWPFLIFIGIACGCAGWEWAKLTRPQASTFAVLLGVGLFAVTMLQAEQWLGSGWPHLFWLNLSCSVSAAVWIFCAVPAVLRGDAQSPAAHAGWTVFAPITLFATWAALAVLFLQHGPFYVLTLLILIWTADIGAYFAGKSFGRHKLAPSISPGKTIEGAAAGIIGVILWVLASAYFWSDSFGASLVARWSWLGAAVCAVLLGSLSIMGDLFESLLKRRAGVKDSSGLLPGHGGVYDRIDAVVAVIPVAYVLTEYLTW